MPLVDFALLLALLLITGLTGFALGLGTTQSVDDYDLDKEVTREEAVQTLNRLYPDEIVVTEKRYAPPQCVVRRVKSGKAGVGPTWEDAIFDLLTPDSTPYA